MVSKKWSRKKSVVVVLLLCAVLLSVLVSSAYVNEYRKIVACDTGSNIAGKIDCWMNLVREEYKAQGIDEAFLLFKFLYKTYPEFAQTGCHRSAHRVGDYAYYFDYITHKDITKMHFPSDATSCGYGFYHGFFEHLVQDNPTVDFVMDTCTHMIDSFSKVAPAMEQTCFHGSGHGFTLAQTDLLVDKTRWDVASFAHEPLKKCESLRTPIQKNIDECRQGVYNVIVDWMEIGNYGLTYDFDRPFAMCDKEAYHRQPDCYYEMAQKLDRFLIDEPDTYVRILSNMKRKDQLDTVLAVSAAGVIQSRIALGDPEKLLSICYKFQASYQKACLRGLLGGMFEHSEAGNEYGRIDRICESPVFQNKEHVDTCYRAISDKIKRYRTPEQIKKSCEVGEFDTRICQKVNT
jgi:uncharacterized protein YutE (UPF0331/DUF86 family)